MAILLVAATAACSDDPKSNAPKSPPRPAPPSQPLALRDISVGPAIARRDSGVLIAGEKVRVGFRVRGGRPPYRVALTAEPLKGALTLAPEADSAFGVEAAVQLDLDARVASGTYPIPIRVHDANGAEVVDEVTITVAGDSETDLPMPEHAPWVTVVDVAGRRRAGYYRGEQVAIRGDLGDSPGEVLVTITEPGGALLASSPATLERGKPFEMRMGLPRLSRPGRYVIVVTQGKTVARSALTILGEPYPPMDKLAIDKLALWGGTDQRTDRKARLIRGETMLVEARFGGWKQEVRGRLHLRDANGKLVVKAGLGSARPDAPRPDARALLARRWTVPKAIARGRYTVEVELQEGDDVSSTFREVLID